jgi:hypothetical protein
LATTGFALRAAILIAMGLVAGCAGITTASLFTCLGLNANANPRRNGQDFESSKTVSRFRAIRPLFLRFSSGSFRVSARACGNQFDRSAGKFFQSIQNIP